MADDDIRLITRLFSQAAGRSRSAAICSREIGDTGQDSGDYAPTRREMTADLVPARCAKGGLAFSVDLITPGRKLEAMTLAEMERPRRKQPAGTVLFAAEDQACNCRRKGLTGSPSGFFELIHLVFHSLLPLLGLLLPLFLLLFLAHGIGRVGRPPAAVGTKRETANRQNAQKTTHRRSPFGSENPALEEEETLKNPANPHLVEK